MEIESKHFAGQSLRVLAGSTTPFHIWLPGLVNPGNGRNDNICGTQIQSTHSLSENLALAQSSKGHFNILSSHFFRIVRNVVRPVNFMFRVPLLYF